MKRTLVPGLTWTNKLVVDGRLIVPAMAPSFPGFADMPAVFATAYMVGMMEWTCLEAVRPHLDPDEFTVGVGVDVKHSAATPLGMEVSAFAELLRVENRTLHFRVTCRDSAEVIGDGLHQRAIVHRARFAQGMARKSQNVWEVD